MPKQQDSSRNISMTVDMNLLDEVKSQQESSERYLDPLRIKWDDYESTVIAEHREAMQGNSQVFDPSLSTIELERTARVSAQSPGGKAVGVSKDDIGKNMVMNLLLGYQKDNANCQYNYLIKQMMVSFWSRVYGYQDVLVPWMMNGRYIGPEVLLVPIRHSFPQPNVSMNDAEWHIVYNRLSIKWLLKQDPEVWNMSEIRALADEMKKGKDEGDKIQHDKKTSLAQESNYNQSGDTGYPYIDTFTRYTDDGWVTWAKRVNTKKGREYLLRNIDNREGQVYPKGMLPIVRKDTLPMQGAQSVGPVQRGKSLQFATNSLINLYFSGMRSKVFPERMVNPDNIDIDTLKFGEGEFWFMDNPGTDVQLVSRGDNSTNEFNAAYGMLKSAMLNQAGTTDTSSSAQVDSPLGKTPQALRLQAAAQGAQDFWEQTMLEDYIKNHMKRWMALNTKFLDEPVAVRVFGRDIQEIAESYPDALQIFNNGESGELSIDKKMFMDGKEPVEFDYDIETGTTARPNLNQETQDLQDILELVAERPDIIAKMEEQTGETINISEIVKQIAKNKGGNKIDRIVVKVNEQPEVSPELAVEGQDPSGLQPGLESNEPVPEFNDPEINQLAQQVLGGASGIPAK